MKPIPKSTGFLQCSIERNTTGINKFAPVFYLKLSVGYGNPVVMTGDKMGQSTTSHIRIHMGQGVTGPKHPNIGKLRANFSNTQYYIYGEDPQEGQDRKQYGTVFYNDKDKLGNKKPREMETYLPQYLEDDISFWPDSKNSRKE